MSAEADDDGDWQEGESRLQGAGAQHVLQVDRGEQERAEQDSRRGEHHHQAAADAPLAEPRDVEQRPAGSQLQRGEHGESAHPGNAEAKSLRRRPAGVGGLRERVDKRAQARGRDGSTAHVQAAPLQSGRVDGGDLAGGEGDGDSDGQVDELCER
jgi:hypothetical protein